MTNEELWALQRAAKETADLHAEQLKQLADEDRERGSWSRILSDVMYSRGGSRMWTVDHSIHDRVMYEERGAKSQGAFSDVMDMEGGEFHWRGGLTFRRSKCPEGSVEIRDHRRVMDDAGAFHWTWRTVAVIPAAEWASIVASVSASGETTESYLQAKSFHGDGTPKAGDAEFYCVRCPFAAHLHDANGSGDGSCPEPFGGRDWWRKKFEERTIRPRTA